MTKKKANRPKHQKDVPLGDTSEEEFNAVNALGKSCLHIQRGIHFGRIKKSLKSVQNITACNGCSNETADLEELPEVWLCLQCGYRGCGRNSENKHAIQHFKTLHSDCHSLVLSTSSGSVWCYDCDDEVSLQSSRILKQCVEFVMKMTPSDSNKSNTSNMNDFVSQQNLQTSVIAEEPSLISSKENNPVQKTNFLKGNNKVSSEKIPIKGLRNLGNTCFFNAVMQNLNQTPLLYYELKRACTPSHFWEVPELIFLNNETAESDNINLLKLSLPRQLPLTNSFLNFLEQMNEVSPVKIQVVNPSPLFGEISRKCPQFRHFQQQDSHELLRQLLDGIRQEEIRRQKKAILKHFDLENVIPEDVDDETKKQIKAYGCYASHTIVEKVFGGLLISTVLCEECKASSQVFEPFMDLSLPLFEEKQQENNEHLYGMLDGGKQDNIKPLRNKKTDWDSDENSAGEYVVSKSKNDPVKPSKYQEKKQKQLSKKEKKKAKYNARNRKNSLNEQSENVCDIQSLENKEDLNENVDDQDSERTSQADHEDEEVWEVKELFGSDEKIDDKKEDEPILQQDLINVVNNNDSDTEDVNIYDASKISQSDKSDGNLVSQIPISSPVIPKYLSQNQVEDTNKSMELEVATVKELSYKDVCSEILKDDVVSDDIQDLKGQSDSGESECANILESVKDVTENFESADFIPKPVNIDDKVPNEDASLRTINENFNTSLKIIDSDQLNIDDRIQTLSLQVKDVRIRRDSDRQENLLNSSESADECESLKTNYTSPKSSIEDSCSFDNCDNWSHSVSEQQTKDWISKTLTTLKPRHHVSPLECSINSCLSHFTKPELLTGNNKFRCENCTELKIKKTGNKKDVVYSNASKQMLIFSPPAVLTLHLKRFQQVGMSLRKVNRFVEFPLILDLASFCCSACSVLPHMSSTEDEILYSLYGVVEHSGRLTSGHYTAYVKANKSNINLKFECQLPLAQCNLEQLLRKFSGIKKNPAQSTDENVVEESQWFYISDSHVKEVSETQVLKCQAYLLFYERIK